MILFKDDWYKYPNAIIDTETKNRSFVRLSALYREMNISNHGFILQLHDPSLQGVDPHDPDLPVEVMLKIALECKINPFYFFREVARVPGTGGQFLANRGNMALYWLFYNHITVFLIQIRQTGKSFSTDTLMVSLTNIQCTNTKINLLTKDNTLRSSNLDRIKDIADELPFYLKQTSKNDISNTEEFAVSSLGNSYRGHLPNKSPKMANKVGRGLTSPIMHIDEGPFCDNISISLPAALASGIAAREAARDKGEPYGIIHTTTAGKKDDPDGRYIHSILEKSAVWTEKFFDCRDVNELERTVRTNSPGGELRVNCTFNHRQLGKTDKWLKDQIEMTGATGEAADRDFFNIWTSGTQLSPLSADIADKIRLSQQNDYFTEISTQYSYITRWYIPEQAVATIMSQEPHVLCLDSSDAAGGDDIGLVIRSIRTGATIGVGNYNETNLITFAEWLCQILEKYPRLTLIIERRSTGSSILDYLLLMLPNREIDPFKRIYNKVVQDAEEYPERYKEINKPMSHRYHDVYVKYKKTFGFATSGAGVTARSDIYGSTLLNSAKNCHDTVRDMMLIDQLLGLEIRNGRVDHADGSKDDLCIAWLLGYWFMTKGKNLSFYGIESREVLSQNRNIVPENTAANDYKLRQTEKTKRDIEELVAKLEVESDTILIMIYENKLKKLFDTLSDSDKVTVSVDDLINNLRSSRNLSYRKGSYFK